MIICRYFVFFIIYSVIGWLWETLFCSLRKMKWQNRGFLFGPICPIYGVAAISAQIVLVLLPPSSSGTISWWVLFLIACAGSAVLEYITSFLLEKCFHARWWDYSHMPLNLHGRICLPASLFFGAAITAFIKFLLPVIEQADLGRIDRVPPLVWEGFSLALMAIFASDIALTIADMTQLLTKLNQLEEEIITVMDERYKVVGDKQALIREKLETFNASATLWQKHHIKNIRRRTSGSENELLNRLRKHLTD